MKLELKHLVGYLPYGLKYIDKDSGEIKIMKTLSSEINMVDFGWGNAHDFNEFKPILRPLSDLDSDYLQEDIENFIGLGNWCDYYYEYLEALRNSCYSNSTIIQAPYVIFQYFLKNHFDVHNLIENDLAININNLNK